MCLDNKEHAIYRICKNDTIGPGSNLPFGFTEQIEIVILLGSPSGMWFNTCYGQTSKNLSSEHRCYHNGLEKASSTLFYLP